MERAGATQFKTTEEHFDYMASPTDERGRLRQRWRHLDKLAKQAPKADYVTYGLAAGLPDWARGKIRCGSWKRFAGQSAVAVSSAQRFRLSGPGGRSRFTELLYPDPGADLGATEDEDLHEDELA